MKIIEGFETAKKILSRQAPKELPGMADSEQSVRQIIDDVRTRGDAALFDYTLKLDGVKLGSFEIKRSEINSAYKKVDGGLVSALKLAAERIRSFHYIQKKSICAGFSKKGVGQLVRPIESVGVYVPGGTASYPSTVLMTAVPARVAGVKEIVMVTPPKKDGTVPLLTLVAAEIAQVDRVFSVGGAEAIAALAFGTESIPRVDKICGPGNIFVVLAKKMVFGTVGIDGLQGPSEVVIVADEKANPEFCASDMLAQAEHDSLASAILIITSRRLADEVNQQVEKQLKGLPRQSIAATSLESNGTIVVVANINEALELANLYAPEHLCLMTDKASSYINKVSNAGCVVTGKKATVVSGDYVAGPSHVLPTGGTAGFSSPLSVADFIKYINVINLDDATLKELGPSAEALAKAEGLEAHARAVAKRLETKV